MKQDPQSHTTSASRQTGAAVGLLKRVPYWLLVAIILGLAVAWKISSDPSYNVIFTAVRQGIGITIRVSVVAYAAAIGLGLLVGLARVSGNRLLVEASSFYVEIIRGLPMLVLLYYVVFAGAPGLMDALNWLGRLMAQASVLAGVGGRLATLTVRNMDFTVRVIIALVVGYSAFLSEIFRAGIESIERGQMEAARSLGMTSWQAMRHVILPQAIRRVLPPLGNDFIAMLKDSSLVSVVGVADITYQGKVYAASTFRFFETYNVVAFLYLVMTIALALLVRYTEQRLATEQ